MKLGFRDKEIQTIIKWLLLIILLLLLFRMNFYTGENKDAYITLVVMLIAVFLFMTEIVSITITAMSIPIVLALTGVIGSDQVFLGFANDNVILFASMFIIGGAMFEIGVAKRIGDYVVNLMQESEKRLLIGIWIVVSITSAFLSNTGTVAVLLPVCLSIVDSAGWSRKNILMVLAMTASTGGMMTLVGTPPNITVNAILQQHQLQPFGFFEFAWVGVPLNILSGLWLLIMARKQMVPGKSKKREKTENYRLSRKELISVLVMVCVVITMASGVLPLHLVAAAGALICVLSGLLSEKRAIEVIDWTTIFLFAGTLVLATALDVTGAGKMIADTVIGVVGNDTSELMLLTVVFWVTTVLTQLMSNTAICAVMAPIGMQIAGGLNANPRGVLIVIAIASSSAFATPMATPPNTLVMGPGNFEMKDFLKTGIPLIIISYLVCIIIIPKLCPLYG